MKLIRVTDPNGEIWYVNMDNIVKVHYHPGTERINLHMINNDVIVFAKDAAVKLKDSFNEIIDATLAIKK